uniref:Uncharacterized protein n=1 Tax=Rhizophora mucronata TaxID=61149 RepID=A0A2P2R4D1_RHIMU
MVYQVFKLVLTSEYDFGCFYK